LRAVEVVNSPVKGFPLAVTRAHSSRPLFRKIFPLYREPMLFGVPATLQEFAYRAPYQPGHRGAVAGRKLFKSGELVTCQGDGNPVRKQAAFRSRHDVALQ